jgi:phosphoribosylanthranilate isomerase
MRVKICGITRRDQGIAIANLGATALGFICVPNTKRYVSAEQIHTIVTEIPTNIDFIGVFANSSTEEITQVVKASGLNAIQLHGDESPSFCSDLKQTLPNIEIIKALRVSSIDGLEQALTYTNYADTLLLDAYDPSQLGGTGKTLDWQILTKFNPTCPWFLAGGLTPDNILTALNQVQPSGIDLSSGVEHAPGDKDLDKVARLFEQLGEGISPTPPLFRKTKVGDELN